MWKVIKKLSKRSAMIVTTHSMEEAEALASKVGIMVEGKFKCFGTV
jgi:ABC-type multidrug transport system ATPase subunit